MCVPIAAVAIATSVASAAYGAYAVSQEAKSKQDYYSYIAEQNKRQADRTEAAAEDQVSGIQDTAAKNADELSRQARQLVGRQKTVLAKSGVWGSSKTFEDISRDTQTQEGRDAAALRFNADRTSWEARAAAAEQAKALREQAVGYGMSGSMARQAGNFGIGSSLLGGATSVADTWMRWSAAKTPGKTN